MSFRQHSWLMGLLLAFLMAAGQAAAQSLPAQQNVLVIGDTPITLYFPDGTQGTLPAYAYLVIEHLRLELGSKTFVVTPYAPLSKHSASAWEAMASGDSRLGKAAPNHELRLRVETYPAPVVPLEGAIFWLAPGTEMALGGADILLGLQPLFLVVKQGSPLLFQNGFETTL